MMVDPYFTYWSWLILAVVLALTEIAVPGIFMIWLAGAAAVTGAITALTGMGFQLQLLCFAVLAVASIYAGRTYFRRHPLQTEDNGLNQRNHRMVGTIVTVVDAITSTGGKVQVGDSPWLAVGPDLPVGAKARVVRVDSATVVVEPV